MAMWLSEIYTCMWVFSQVSLSAAAGRENNGRPNIVLILADDLGWNDVGYHNPDMKTPNIDRLAAQGIKLNQSYTQSICTPTRSALMTGRYPFKTGMQHGVLLSNDNACLPTQHQLLSEDLRHHGYSTHLVGKWHLGFCKWACTPTYRGFDTFFGYYSGALDYYTKTYASDYTGHPYLDLRDDIYPAWTYSYNTSYSTHMFTGRATDVINQHNTSTPLFLYLSLQNPHFPLQVPEKYTNMYPDVVNERRRTYCGMVSALDEGIGNVTAALEERGMMDNTLILFLSDNGPDMGFHGNSFPLRGAKFSIWEGGHRSVGFLHGAGLQKTGVTYDGLVHVVDWRPTLMAAAGGGKVAPEADIDGMNLWENIRTGSLSPRTEFVYNLDDVQDDFFNVGNAALRDGDYKLILGYSGSYNDWYTPQNNTEDEPLHLGCYIAGDHPEQLYNLREDPTERRNIALQEPEVVAKLKLKINQYRKMMVPAQTRQCSPSAEPVLHGGVWSPGWC
ncbi:arylsulfatase J-like [Haliotis rufescens]|uniref:arylsulfatase J-like n=1 Tax=Haliotis rufescens TaxID=6454 RepID=UPI00201F51C9|nr:arylsulfatase J-like [Haliotis rufescens]XP_048250186.1 arylsulfatase J-like [Haliotis rufescens]XP_048250187.1 arylsulfatase J-like [Haliotis rufescens]XP_048250188.1 arylsulfatase J-like [Haliotis rufescens]XP_048250189.1 arylsulfatase J-like [Haliotis rufescens]XP_048250190.1 arylsulfatase J-like [Haliotis rufescens]XP_048250191.1 arylsulfatase J-like [Haliotis rufescens]